MNSHRIKLYRLFLSIGILITFLTSVTLTAWHEHIFYHVPTTNHNHHRDHPSFHGPNNIANNDGVEAVHRHHQHDRMKLNDGLPQWVEVQVKDDTTSHDDWPPVLSVYMEPPSTTDNWYKNNPTSDNEKQQQQQQPITPLPMRNIHSQNLTRLQFPRMKYASSKTTISTKICNNVPALLPIDEFGSTIHDPYLPWIHDLFISRDDGKHVNIIAQNRRRCHKGKFHNDDLKCWEGQVALFQPVALKRVGDSNNNGDAKPSYRLSTHEEADSDGVETRFICRFKSLDYTQKTTIYQGETLSTYPFNYEFVNWRKRKKTMVEDGKEQSFFWLSPLMFNCPIPAHLQQQSSSSSSTITYNNNLLLDIIPIRTPTRRNDRDGFFFHEGHGGPTTFDATKNWGTKHVLPKLEDSGRWENLPVCNLQKTPSSSETVETNNNEKSTKVNAIQQQLSTIKKKKKKPHRLVACTWTSALHQRRGNERRITDGKARLREWIAFNLQVGFDHVYVFDNTGANATIFRLKNEIDPDFGNTTSSNGNNKNNDNRIHDDLSSVTNLFPPSQVTRIEWPATICNNNRPAHNDPGERSSQYAAEAACRTRYGPDTDWMASMDPDEYFVPMGNYTSWKEILDRVDGEEGRKVLKFRSTRARPLLSTLVPTFDEGAKECTHEMAKHNNQCLVKREDRTYLETYNCEYIKSPKPERFARAMKQFYRPDFVLSHFVHYSTVTTDLATEKRHTKGKFIQDATTNLNLERFVDEIEEGVLIHAKTTVPAETFSRGKMCKTNAPSHCMVGIPCPDDLPFSDALHTKNVFHNEKGEFCNCWTNRKVEKYWLPKLKDALSNVGSGV